MDPATLATAFSIGSSLLGGLTGISGNRRARSAASAQARLTYMQRREESRRVELQQGDILSQNRAAIGASNIQFRGSAMSAMARTRREFARDLRWRDESARLERDAIRRGAPGRSSDIGIGLSSAASIGSSLLNYYNNRG